MEQSFLLYIGGLVTLFLICGLGLDILCKIFGKKIPLKKLELSYYSNYSQVGEVYHIQGEYSFELKGKLYTAKRMNFLGFAASALSKKRIETQIQKVKKQAYVYVFLPYPKINCLMPFYYSIMFLLATFLFGPLALLAAL